jgi:hypothetical protein
LPEEGVDVDVGEVEDVVGFVLLWEDELGVDEPVEGWCRGFSR